MRLEYIDQERDGVVVRALKLHPSGAGFVREHEAAAYIGVSFSQLRKMRRNGDSFDEADIKKIGNSYWYRLTGLNFYIEEVCAFRAA